MKKKDDIANKTIVELDKLASDLRGQIEKVGMDLRMRKIKDTNAVKKIKYQIAKTLTVKREQEMRKG